MRLNFGLTFILLPSTVFACAGPTGGGGESGETDISTTSEGASADGASNSENSTDGNESSTHGEENSTDGDESSTDGDDTTGGEVFDCAEIPSSPATTILSGPRAARGIAFDDEGHLIGAGYEAVYRSTLDSFSVFVPGLQGFGQLDPLPDGGYAMADGERIVRISSGGSYEVISYQYGDYGLRVGPGGMIYTGNSDGVGRIDPDTGERELFVAVPTFEGEGARTMDFSPGLDRLYIGTHGSEVYVVELDANLEPTGPATLFVDLSQGAGCPEWDHSPGCWHDGLRVDVCGNVYVAIYGSNQLVRVSPDGQSAEVVRDMSSDPEMFGHGITWGSGLGGFAHDAIYQPTPKPNDNPVAEVAVGVPYRSWTGTVLNGPA
jgi:hypothetical protein